MAASDSGACAGRGRAPLDSGQLPYAQTESANQLWVVAKGAVALTVADSSGTEEVISKRRRPEAFGEAALYDEGGRMVAAHAREDTDVLTLDGERFRQVVRQKRIWPRSCCGWWPLSSVPRRTGADPMPAD